MTTPAPRASRLRSRALSRPLAVGFVIVTLAALIAWVGSAALAGETRWLDEALLHWARDARAGRPWLAEVMRDFSGLGSTVVLALFSLGVVAYLALFSSRRTAWLVATSVLSGWLVMQLLKRLFARLRPDSALAELVVPGMSFPSGHASMSALVFLTAGALLAATRARRRERAFVLAVAALATLLVGTSRVMLGVHWATDVLAGWAFGLAWAMGWLALARHWAGPGGWPGDTRSARGTDG